MNPICADISFNNGTVRIKTINPDYVASTQSKIHINLSLNRESEFGSVPNRHEKLFKCKRSGKAIMSIMLQIFYIMSIVYLAAYIVYGAEKSYKDYKDKDSSIPITIIICVAPVIMALIWFILLPPILTKFTIITNVSLYYYLLLK